VVASQPPFREGVITERENIVGIRYHATTAEDTANLEDFICAVVTVTL
jgi:hypothetical protein